MNLGPGTRFGSYELVGALGAGGMGEVYRARDTRLHREVAVKVLPEAFARDVERMKRLEREAQVLASLNHPAIAAIYGLEEWDGNRVLVMELAAGEDLAERLKRGAIPTDDALSIARRMAEGLEAAHEKGIVHRDLKPGNVKVSSAGEVKLLDFGLAKALEGEGELANGGELSRSPTLSRHMTEVGVILGTAAYMSPEQARGKPVDKRSDVWAYGVVLFEMLSGQRLFSGETVSDTLAAVLRQEIDWTLLPASTPASARRLLERCLDRDPKQRLRDIGEARIAIEAREQAATPPLARPALSWRRALPWLAAGSVLGAAASLSLLAPWRSSPRPAPLRLSAELGADVSLSVGTIALSPDGAILAFAAAKGAGEPSQLYVRRLDELAATLLPGTEGAHSPFFSPGGEWIAFFDGRRLKKVSVTGGASVAICDTRSGSQGGTWAEDGTIFFQPTGGAGVALHRVPSSGGTPEPVATLAPGEVIQRWPQALPGGKALLYTSHHSQGGYDHASLVVQPLPQGARKVVLKGGYYGRYLESGHLAYVREGTLFVAPFDIGRLEVKGPAVPALEGVWASPLGGGWALFAFSRNGTLAYFPGRDDMYKAPIDWMDRAGKTTPLRAASASWSNLAFSPDGRRLAMQIHDGKQEDVWVYDWARGTLTRSTDDAAYDGWPVWSPDGRRLAFSSTRADNATFNLYGQRADGTGGVERLTESKHTQWAASWHPSGRSLALLEVAESGGPNLMILPFEGDEASGWKPGRPVSFLSDAFSKQSPMFSPDGRWLAYWSNETGRFEVYVRPFPGPGAERPISTDGGSHPVWSRTRRELFFSTLDRRIMVAPYTTDGDSFVAEKPRLWSERPFRRSRGLQWRPYDLHPDGERFALAPPAEGETVKRDKVVLVFNFFDELRRIAPVGER